MTSDASVMVTVFASACHNVGEVFEREQLFCQEQRIFDDILAVLECAEHQIVDRHQHDDRAQSEHQLFDKRAEFLLFFHQKISSLFFIIGRGLRVWWGTKETILRA